METQPEKISKKDKREEAILRMKLMRLSKGIIKQFREKNRICVFCDFGEAFLDYDTALHNKVQDFEKQHNALVYLIIRSKTESDTVDCLFYVSNEREKWEVDQTTLLDRSALVYKVYYNHPFLSKFDSITYALSFFKIPYLK